MATSNQPATPEVGVSLPAWLEDADQSAVLLGRLVQDPSIQAALILRGKELWAQAGELLEHAGPELAQKVFQYWSTDGGRDLTRYVRLTSVPGEYILYATGLTGDMVLAILYNEETPFSKMRLQAAELAHTLLSTSLEDGAGKWIQEYPENTQEDNPALEAALSSLPPLFDDVPPPTVQGNQTAGGTSAEPPVLEQPASAPVAQTTPAAPQIIQSPSLPSTQPVTPHGMPGSGLPPIGPTETISSPLNERVAAPAGLLGGVPISRPAPSFAPTPAQLPAYLPVSTPALSDLYLAVVLLPRLPKHHLSGDLAVLLPQWVAQVCVAYGWRLEALRVRPDYVEWVVNIPPAVSASQHLRLMRRQTSQFIFAEFPTLARENPSGEFWAPGYLVTSNAQLPAESVIQDFISQVRRQQGVSKPLPDQA